MKFFYSFYYLPRKKARKVNKSALAIKENLPIDCLDIDLSFQMPEEVNFGTSYFKKNEEF